MSAIRSKNTKPEIILRSMLHRRGYRYRLHDKTLPGKPDIVFKKLKTAIFIHGCFWHQHESCKEGRIPLSRVEYWKPKLLGNVERDKNHHASLLKLEWHVVVVWECEINSDVDNVIAKLDTLLRSRHSN